jgi:hypothetical protein
MEQKPSSVIFLKNGLSYFLHLIKICNCYLKHYFWAHFLDKEMQVMYFFVLYFLISFVSSGFVSVVKDCVMKNYKKMFGKYV